MSTNFFSESPAIYCMVKIIAHPDYKRPYAEHDVKFYATIEEATTAKQNIVAEVTKYLEYNQYCIQDLLYASDKYYTNDYMDMQPYDISITKVTICSGGKIDREIIFDIQDIDCPCNKCISDNSEYDNSNGEDSNGEDSKEDNNEDNNEETI